MIKAIIIASLMSGCPCPIHNCSAAHRNGQKKQNEILAKMNTPLKAADVEALGILKNFDKATLVKALASLKKVSDDVSIVYTRQDEQLILAVRQDMLDFLAGKRDINAIVIFAKEPKKAHHISLDAKNSMAFRALIQAAKDMGQRQNYGPRRD